MVSAPPCNPQAKSLPGDTAVRELRPGLPECTLLWPGKPGACPLRRLLPLCPAPFVGDRSAEEGEGGEEEEEVGDTEEEGEEDEEEE